MRTCCRPLCRPSSPLPRTRFVFGPDRPRAASLTNLSAIEFGSGRLGSRPSKSRPTYVQCGSTKVEAEGRRSELEKAGSWKVEASTADDLKAEAGQKDGEGRMIWESERAGRIDQKCRAFLFQSSTQMIILFATARQNAFSDSMIFRRWSENFQYAFSRSQYEEKHETFHVKLSFTHHCQKKKFKQISWEKKHICWAVQRSGSSESGSSVLVVWWSYWQDVGWWLVHNLKLLFEKTPEKKRLNKNTSGRTFLKRSEKRSIQW